MTKLKALTVWITTNCIKFLETGISDHLTCLLRNLYTGQEATVRTEHGRTDWFQIGKVFGIVNKAEIDVFSGTLLLFR